MRFLGPFHSTAAELKISSQKSIWIDEKGEHLLSEEPLFHQWFHKRWWEEIGLAFGLLSKNMKPYVTLETSGETTEGSLLFEREGRSMKCNFSEANSSRPSSCQLSSGTFLMNLDFSFSECRSTL